MMPRIRFTKFSGTDLALIMVLVALVFALSYLGILQA